MQTIITFILYLTTFTIPLVFTTINYELFEFPKFILLLTFTLILSLAWFIDIYPQLKSHTFKFTPPTSPISIGIIAILLTQFIATLSSINPHTSFWGYYSRFHQGLLTTICYTLIYFIAIKYLNYKSTQKLIKISINTAILISLYAVAQHFGIDKNLWVQDVVNRPFSTLGQPNWLAAYLLPHLFLSLYFNFTHSKLNHQTISNYLTYLIILVALLLTKSRSGFIALFLAYLTYWILLIRNFNFSKLKQVLFIYTTLTSITILLIGNPLLPNLNLLKRPPTPTLSTPQGTQLASGGTESGDIRKIVWTGTLDLIKRKPFFGTGPETFAYTYYWTRPIAHNLTSEWDFLYNKAHNEYLNFAATTGIVGLLAYLYWHFTILKTALHKPLKTKKANQLTSISLNHYYPVLGASLISFSVTNFFGFSVIPVYLLMTILTTIPTSIANKPSKKSTQQTPSSQYYLLLITSCLLLTLFPLRLFFADIYFAKGKAYLSVKQFKSAQTYLNKAIHLRPTEPLYHSFLAETYAQIISQTNSTQYLNLAKAEINYTQQQNPWHLNFAKSRTKAWIALANIEPKLYQQAEQELIHARQLAPTDPKLAYNLGLIYSRLDQPQQAIKEMQEAISLKPNYYQPYYALSLLYESNQQIELLISLLKQAQANLKPLPEPLQQKLDKYTLK